MALRCVLRSASDASSLIEHSTQKGSFRLLNFQHHFGWTRGASGILRSYLLASK